LSGSGKSTIANALEKKLFEKGYHTMLLDGDNVRKGLNYNLDFSEVDRIENIRRVAEVSKLMNDAGLIVINSFITPLNSEREQAKSVIGEDSFKLIHIATPLEECEKRDPKGLYEKARKGLIPDFTGISSLYEIPVNPNLTYDTTSTTVENIVEDILKHLYPEMTKVS
jgi:bifunctional enzyme CysN/CysC